MTSQPSTQFVPQQWWDLAHGYCDGAMEAEQVAHLNRLIIENQAFADFLAEYLDVHASLSWNHPKPNENVVQFLQAYLQLERGRKSDESRNENRVDSADSLEARNAPHKIPIRTWIQRILLGAAAVLLLGFGYYTLTDFLQPVRFTVVQTQDAIAKSDDTTTAKLLRAGATVRNEIVELEAGLVELVSSNGVKMVLEGPFRFEPAAKDVSRLHYGKLFAQVPTGISGFTVLTPDHTLVDLGTAFGVEVLDRNRAATQIVQGRVSIQLTAERNASNKTPLFADQGSTFVMEGTRVERIEGLSAEKWFVQNLGEPTRFLTVGTGRNRRHDAIEPSWTILDLTEPRQSDAIHPAYVFEYGLDYALKNEYVASQWIGPKHIPAIRSMQEGQKANPSEMRKMVFRHRFEIPEAYVPRAMLNVRFTADDLVSSIRLNGKIVPLDRILRLEDKAWQSFQSLSIQDGFHANQNTIEFEVDDERGNLLFRAELEGYLR